MLGQENKKSREALKVIAVLLAVIIGTVFLIHSISKSKKASEESAAESMTIEEIPEKLGMKRSYYYLLKKEAISTLSTRLWFPLPSRQVGMLIEAASSCM